MRKPTLFSFLVFLVLSAAAPAWAAFTDNGDGTVTDSVTGLTWDKCTWGQTNNTDCSGGSAVNWNTWAQALAVAVTANGSAYKGHGDWRLPNIKELESLLKVDATSSPALDTTAFPNTPIPSSSYFWSSTPSFVQPDKAWIIDFHHDNPAPLTFSGKANYVDNYVRLVRGGQPSGAFDSQDSAAPVYQGATLGAGNTVATLTFNETLVNNLADFAALKAAVTVAVNGASFTALAAADTVALSGATLVVSFATPLGGGANQLKLAANSVKDASDNVLTSTIATGSPVYQSAAINGSNTVFTLTFSEAVVNNLTDLAALKAAITLAADSTTFTALAAGDAVALSGSTLVVSFATPLVGTANKLRLAANSLRNGMGTLASVTTVPISIHDITPPAYAGAGLAVGNVVATLAFNDVLVNNLADLAALKAAVSFAADGATFNALAAGDTVTLSGATLVVTFAAPLGGNANKIRVAANSLKDAAGNVLASAVTTAALNVVSVIVFNAPTSTGTGNATVIITDGGAGCAFASNAFVPLSAVAAAPPAGVIFPVGLLNFALNGCATGNTITVSVVYPYALPVGTQYWKYGPTPGNATPHWYTIPATIAGNTVTYTITDGGLGDDDLLANGSIADPGGPGAPGVPAGPGAPGAGVAEIPTLSEWGLLLLSLLLGAASLRAAGRKSRRW